MRQAKKCVKWASKGYLVIADRWPTVKRSKMDGPKIIGSTALLETLSRIERDIYGKIPNADIAIVLKVTKEDSLLRNKLREKLEKESDAGIVSRFEENKVIEPLADRVFIYNNHKSVAEARDDLFDLIWRNIASFQENHPANVSEYLGLPGSGKSTILNKLLSTQGGSIAVYGLWDKSLSRFPVKASLLLKGAFLHGLIIDSVRNIVSRNIDNKHMRYRVYLNWIYVIEFIRGNVINKNGVYLDQGLMQLLWSTYFRSRSVPSYSSDASDLLVILDHIGVYTLNVKLLMFDDLVVLERLTARGGNGSVLDGVISTSCSEWMQAKRSLANVVKLINEIQEIDPVRINLARVY